MWIRKQPAEVVLNKYSGVARLIAFDVLKGVVLWGGLIRLSYLCGLPYSEEASGYVAAGLIAMIIPASWLIHRHKSQGVRCTMVCDSCGSLKASDGRSGCRCGGRFYAVQEMKWVAPGPWTQSTRRRTQA